MKYLEVIFILILVASVFAETDDVEYLVGRKQIRYSIEELPNDKFATISSLSNLKHLREASEQIAIPRIVGSDGHKKVRQYIVESLENLQWNVEIHKFHDETPIFGKLHFHNIIATLNPKAERYLVLSCHYDSKYMPDYEFIGAIDSAVPCAMLLNLANVLHEKLKELRDSKLSLILLFFDGEEAFKEWGPKDSIYGARHLADKWEKEGFLDRIDILLLLDLIGTPDPKFYSFYMNTETWYSNLINVEIRLSNAGLLEHYASSGVGRLRQQRYFQPEAMRSSYVEDDHTPFLNANVPVLHLIPMPFPSVWHTKDDNLSNIDYMTTENIARIIRVFTMEYLLGNEKVDRNKV